jgi:hypothetical protein
MRCHLVACGMVSRTQWNWLREVLKRGNVIQTHEHKGEFKEP